MPVEREREPLCDFLLPMGNINRGPGPAGLYAADLSTPYGKHKLGQGVRVYFDHQPFYSLWET